MFALGVLMMSYVRLWNPVVKNEFLAIVAIGNIELMGTPHTYARVGETNNRQDGRPFVASRRTLEAPHARDAISDGGGVTGNFVSRGGTSKEFPKVCYFITLLVRRADESSILEAGNMYDIVLYCALVASPDRDVRGRIEKCHLVRRLTPRQNQFLRVTRVERIMITTSYRAMIPSRRFVCRRIWTNAGPIALRVLSRNPRPYENAVKT